MMADLGSTCPMCFETRVLKIVGRCKHAFCTECLTTVLESHDGQNETFACPTCKVDCPRPHDGVCGLVGFTGEDAAAVTGIDDEETLPAKKEGKKELLDGDDEMDHVVKAKCQICLHRKTTVKAVNLCAECGNLYMCVACTAVHGKNKATTEHTVLPLTYERKKREALCGMHNSVLISYCNDCGKAVCMICIMLEHGDHAVEKLEATIQSKADEVKLTLDNRRDDLKRLEHRRNELALLHGTALLEDDNKAILHKEIEDHVDQSIRQMVKLKEELKKHVDDVFQIAKDVPEEFKKLPGQIEKLNAQLKRAQKVLNKTELHPDYLDELNAVQNSLATTLKVGTQEKTDNWNALGGIHWNRYTFIPEPVPSSLGELKKESKPDRFAHEEVSKFTMPCDSADKFIPCVANLGGQFAVAHPTRPGTPSSAVNIYEFPDKLKLTLRDHVHPLYDMTATPDGRLAVLSIGLNGSCAVKIFDPNHGFIRSTCDIDVTYPMSIGVTLEEQYAILGRNKQGQNHIVLVGKEGEKLFSLGDLKEHITRPMRVACGRDYIHITGTGNTYALFEIRKDQRLIPSDKCPMLFGSGVTYKDISITIWEDLYLAYIFSNNLVLEKITYVDNTKSWIREDPERDAISVTVGTSKANKGARVSAREGHIIVSYGQTVKVYKILC